MQNGIIKTYKPDRAFGFIASDDGDVFFHLSDVVNFQTVERGMAVEFELGCDRQGRPCAENIRVMPRAA